MGGAVAPRPRRACGGRKRFGVPIPAPPPPTVAGARASSPNNIPPPPAGETRTSQPFRPEGERTNGHRSTSAGAAAPAAGKGGALPWVGDMGSGRRGATRALAMCQTRMLPTPSRLGGSRAPPPRSSHGGELERGTVEGGPAGSVDVCFSIERLNGWVPTAMLVQADVAPDRCATGAAEPGRLCAVVC